MHESCYVDGMFPVQKIAIHPPKLINGVRPKISEILRGNPEGATCVIAYISELIYGIW
jgi:hypothetical protein